MRRIMQVVFVALFCLILAAPAMAIGTMGTTGTHARQSGTMTGTSTSNGYGNGVGNELDYGTDTRMNVNGMNNRNNGDGFGTLDLNNNNNNRNRNGVNGNSYTGGTFEDWPLTQTMVRIGAG